MTIDLGPKGPAGVEAHMWDNGSRHVWVNGSDHVFDMVHHILLGAASRERRWAEAIAERVAGESLQYVVGGSSFGAAVAVLVTDLLRGMGHTVSCYVFGPKRAPKLVPGIIAYQHRGDIVPLLPPWRPGYLLINKIGTWGPLWKVHTPEAYHEIRSTHGLWI
jgi:predicted alternative tryptophan synthase beta-subunit